MTPGPVARDDTWLASEHVRWAFAVNNDYVAVCESQSLTWLRIYSADGKRRDIALPTNWPESRIRIWALLAADGSAKSRFDDRGYAYYVKRRGSISCNGIAIRDSAILGVTTEGGATWLLRCRPSTGELAVMFLHDAATPVSALFWDGLTIGVVLDQGADIFLIPWVPADTD
jgi:hypothetical protein